MIKKVVKVKPNSKHQKIVEEPDGSLTVFLKAPPVEGKANTELIHLLAKHFGVAKRAIAIQTGHRGRQKMISLDLSQ